MPPAGVHLRAREEGELSPPARAYAGTVNPGCRFIHPAYAASLLLELQSEQMTVANFPFTELKQAVRVFCFLDLEHPAVAWAIMRGMMVSGNYAATPTNPSFVSFMQAGMVETLNNRRIFNEDLIERVRVTFFPHQISRIRGMFFFRSRNEAEARIEDPNWPPYFKSTNLLELELRYSGTLTDVDSNWITFAPLEDGRITIGDLQWIWRYWAGEVYGNDPVWERLANGVALVLDEQVRRRSYQICAGDFSALTDPDLNGTIGI